MKFGYPNIKALKIFCHYSESLSIPTTAKAFDLSTSAIRHHLKSLQTNLGVPLLLNKGKKLIPTT